MAGSAWKKVKLFSNYLDNGRPSGAFQQTQKESTWRVAGGVLG
jgi:hypothetical protein